MEIVVGVVVLVALLAWYVTWTAGRIDRLHARVDAARGVLDAQLVRRASAAIQLVTLAAALLGPELAARLGAAARGAVEADAARREGAENDLSRVLREVPAPAGDADAEGYSDLVVAATRVGMARQFYNDAVRDTRALRGRRVPRLFRLGGRRPLPAYFEIDDTGMAGPAPTDRNVPLP
jgi:hypothetical protein